MRTLNYEFSVRGIGSTPESPSSPYTRLLARSARVADCNNRQPRTRAPASPHYLMYIYIYIYIYIHMYTYLSLSLSLYIYIYMLANCWQLPDGVRPSGVVAEVPRFPLTLKGKREPNVSKIWQPVTELNCKMWQHVRT